MFPRLILVFLWNWDWLWTFDATVFYLPSARILGEHQHAEFLWCFDLNPEPQSGWTSILPSKVPNPWVEFLKDMS